MRIKTILIALLLTALPTIASAAESVKDKVSEALPDASQAKDIVTNPDVLDLFKKGSSFSILVYTVLAVLLVVVVLFGGITIYSMLNAAKASKAFADAMKDTRDFAEKFASYKSALDTNFDSLHGSITTLSTQVSRDFRGVFDRMAAFEKSISEMEQDVNKAISIMDKNISTMYTYCVASEQVKKARRTTGS